VPDLQHALQDLLLRDLYAAFRKVASPAYFRASWPCPRPEERQPARNSRSARLRRRKPSASWISLKEPRPDFVRIAAEYLDGASGATGFAAGLSARAERRISWKEFALSTGAARDLGAYAEKSRHPSPEPLRRSYGDLADTFAEMEISRLSRRLPGPFKLRGCSGRRDRGDARRSSDHWCLDRKLREALRTTAGTEKGVPPVDAPEARSLPEPRAPEQTDRRKGISPCRIAKAAFLSEDARPSWS
jgi:hypothetical protein